MTKVIKYVIFLLISVNAELRVYMMDGPIQRIGGRIYKKELLTNQFSAPKELAYDSGSRNLFFMYMDDALKNSGRAYINVVTKNANKINGIHNNKAVAVDAESGDVYFGSEDGLYRFDPINNQAYNVGLYNLNIMKIVIRNNEMYLVDANDHSIYKVYYEGTSAVKVGDMKTVMEFDVDFKKNIHFVNLSGLFCSVHGNELVKNKDLKVVYNFLSDEEKTFGVTDDGLYEINCINGTAVKVAELDFIPRSIIFGDYGDVFYSADDNIYRLKPINSYQVYKIQRRT